MITPENLAEVIKYGREHTKEQVISRAWVVLLTQATIYNKDNAHMGAIMVTDLILAYIALEDQLNQLKDGYEHKAFSE